MNAGGLTFTRPRRGAALPGRPGGRARCGWLMGSEPHYYCFLWWELKPFRILLAWAYV